jgi:pSer/pThr/pTyr-binding forkhead associated (FHA) protein
VLPDGRTQVSALVDEQYIIGRGPQSDIQFPDTGVSAMHAKLTRSEDGYVIEDLSSRNGTYVNDSPVERQLLKDGDEIRIGRVLLEYGHVFDVT